MSTTIKTWYDFVMQQMAAESYFHEADKFGGLLSQKQVLMFGSNNPSLYSELDPATLPILPGATRMTETQATDFLTRYTILSHLPNTASGFSATLMRDNITGAYTLAMRSTEYANPDKGGDWDRDGLNGADGEIFTYGFAFGQIASMESYYEHLKLGESYNSLTMQWESDPSLNDFKTKFGGPVKAQGAVLNVSGYSLSGQLAYVFTTLHPEVDNATVINGTGMGNIAIGKTLAQMVGDFRQQLADKNINLSDPSPLSVYAPADPSDPSITTLYQDIRLNILKAYGTSYSQNGTANLANGRITQLFGHGAHNDLELVANAGRHVTPQAIFIEDQPNVTGLGPITWLDTILGLKSDFGTTHSITLLADSLAVMSIFEKLNLDMDTKKGMTTAYNLLAASSNKLATGLFLTNGTAESDSLEIAVEALGKLILGKMQFKAIVGSDELPRGEQTGSFSNLANREKFYKALDAIDKEIKTKTSIIFGIETMVGEQNGDTILAAALDTQDTKRAMAYRYALLKGNPFVVTGFDYAPLHNMKGELDLYDPATGTGDLSVEYLKMRADYLERKIYYNLHDAEYVVKTPGIQIPDYNLTAPDKNSSSNVKDNYLLTAAPGTANDSRYLITLERKAA